MPPAEIDLETALKLLALPRDVGPHPETGEMISAGIGRFGPYLKLGSTYKSLPADDDVLSIGLNRAVVLLAEAKKGPAQVPGRVVGDHPRDGKLVSLNNGRFGPYVKHGKVMASLPKAMAANADELTLQQAVELLDAKIAKDGGKVPAAKAAKGKAAEPEAASEDAGAEPKAAKKPAARKRQPPRQLTPQPLNEGASSGKVTLGRRRLRGANADLQKWYAGTVCQILEIAAQTGLRPVWRKSTPPLTDEKLTEETSRKATAFPSREDVLAFIRNSSVPVGKREIAREFHLRGDDRIALKALLRELESDGSVERDRARRLAPPTALPAVSVLEVVEIDTDGEVLARPITWTSEEPPPKIFMQPERRGHPALLPGDRVLAQLHRQNDRVYTGRTIRKLEKTGSARVLGIYEMTPDGARLRPTDKRQRAEFLVIRPFRRCGVG